MRWSLNGGFVDGLMARGCENRLRNLWPYTWLRPAKRARPCISARARPPHDRRAPASMPAPRLVRAPELHLVGKHRIEERQHPSNLLFPLILRCRIIAW